MNKISYFKTEDGSTGLFSYDADDIYHSKTGALKESFDKFIIPSGLDRLLSQKSNVNILDICSGIGYNLKASLITAENKCINVDCIDTDKDLIFISPFIEDSIDNPDLKLFILYMILKNGFDIHSIYSTLEKYSTNENKKFFSASMIKMLYFLIEAPYSFNGESQNLSFLHNIYYSYISQSTTYCQNTNKYKDCHINYYIDDARSFIKSANKKYDIVFLDAFSPQKDPRLWSVDFLAAIKNNMHNDSILVSYSKSTPFRSALRELNFSVGKTFINNVDMGTCASLNSTLILNKLTNYDIELLSTRSGITYKDPALNLSAVEIINKRNIEQKFSQRLSHTKFLKLYSQ